MISLSFRFLPIIFLWWIQPTQDHRKQVSWIKWAVAATGVRGVQLVPNAHNTVLVLRSIRYCAAVLLSLLAIAKRLEKQETLFLLSVALNNTYRHLPGRFALTERHLLSSLRRHCSGKQWVDWCFLLETRCETPTPFASTIVFAGIVEIAQVQHQQAEVLSIQILVRAVWLFPVAVACSYYSIDVGARLGQKNCYKSLPKPIYTRSVSHLGWPRSDRGITVHFHELLLLPDALPCQQQELICLGYAWLCVIFHDCCRRRQKPRFQTRECALARMAGVDRAWTLKCDGNRDANAKAW